MFTYTYNAAGRLVGAQSVTTMLVYTYNASGLRVAQRVADEVTVFAWDWAAGVPEMLSEDGHLYLVGHETLGRWDSSEWSYYLPDALGSVRQLVDTTGVVTSNREWTPFGMEAGAAQAGLGYTGEWWDADAGLLYLRARWYEPGMGGGLSRDPLTGFPMKTTICGSKVRERHSTSLAPAQQCRFLTNGNSRWSAPLHLGHNFTISPYLGRRGREYWWDRTSVGIALQRGGRGCSKYGENNEL